MAYISAKLAAKTSLTVQSGNVKNYYHIL